MAGFLYFVKESLAAPLDATLPTKALAKVGLSHLAEVTGRALKNGAGQEWSVQPCASGPDGTSGFILSVKRATQDDPPNWQYVAERQEWLSVRGQWIGWNSEHPPTPNDLQRAQTAGGASVTDLFGREWLIPIARMPGAEFGRLATYYAPGVDKPSPRLHKFEQSLWDAANAVAPAMLDGSSLDPLAVIDLVGLALARNYRVSPLEQSALADMGQPLLDDSFCGLVAMVVCHWDFIEQVQKKTPA